MVSLKEKVSILETLNAPALDFNKIITFFDYTEDKLFSPFLLKSIFARLVEIDSRVAAVYEVLSLEEWEVLVSEESEEPSEERDRLHSEYADIVQGIKTIVECYPRLLAELKKLSIENVLKTIIPSLFKSKTKNIQFILFQLASVSPRPVLAFLMNRCKRDPRIYAPFFCSLLARLEMNSQLRARSTQAYFKHLKSLKMSKHPDFCVLAQFFLYTLCFYREGFFYEGVYGWIEDLFATDVPLMMNRDVVVTFCKIFESTRLRTHTPSSEDEENKAFSQETSSKAQRVVHKVYTPLECDALYFFPFDRPVCSAINACIDNYVEFSD